MRGRWVLLVVAASVFVPSLWLGWAYVAGFFAAGLTLWLISRPPGTPKRDPLRFQTLALSATNLDNWKSETAYNSAIAALAEQYADHHKRTR